MQQKLNKNFIGIPDSHIILMLSDDMACNPRNPTSAQVNKPQVNKPISSILAEELYYVGELVRVKLLVWVKFTDISYRFLTTETDTFRSIRMMLRFVHLDYLFCSYILIKKSKVLVVRITRGGCKAAAREVRISTWLGERKAKYFQKSPKCVRLESYKTIAGRLQGLRSDGRELL